MTDLCRTILVWTVLSMTMLLFTFDIQCPWILPKVFNVYHLFHLGFLHTRNGHDNAAEIKIRVANALIVVSETYFVVQSMVYLADTLCHQTASVV